MRRGIHPGTCGARPALVVFGHDDTTSYVYDATTKKLVGVVVANAAGTATACYGEVDGACTTSPANLCSGGAPAGS